MRRAALPITAIAAAAALVALLLYGLTTTGDDHSLDAKVASGKRPPAPSRSLPVLGGHGEQSLANYRGKIVVLNFWAHWCDPCAAEAPLLERTQRRIHSDDATVLGISYDDTVPNAEKFVRKYHITYPTLRDVGTHLAQDYGTKALPETFVIDRHGRIAAIHRGELTATWLRANLDPLLKQ